MLPFAALMAIGAGSIVGTTALASGSTYTAQTPISNNWLFAVSCPPTQTTRCWTDGDTRNPDGSAGTGVIYHDATGGGSGPWVADAGAPATPDGLHGISCPVTQSCWAVGGNGTILFNGNATLSTTWTPQVSNAGSHFLYSVSCGDNSHCVAVGDTGTVVWTSNAGTTWNYVQPTTEHLFGVSCATTTSCVAVGTNGKVIRTANGGANWVSESSGTTEGLDGVYCKAYCFAVGDLPAGGAPAVILYSHGVGSWAAASSNTSRATLWAVSCTAQATCSAAGNAGQIIDTKATAGTQWFDNSPAIGSELHGVSCRTVDKVCVVVGENGAVYKGTP